MLNTESTKVSQIIHLLHVRLQFYKDNILFPIRGYYFCFFYFYFTLLQLYFIWKNK